MRNLRSLRPDWPIDAPCATLVAVMLVTCLGLSAAACARPANDTPTLRPPEETTPALPAVSESEIASASAVVRAHVEAIVRGDGSAYRATLGRFKSGGWDAAQFARLSAGWRGVEVESLALSGLFTTESPPETYEYNFGSPPFATIVLRARFKRPDAASNLVPEWWDFILIRETRDGPWVIHDWGG